MATATASGTRVGKVTQVIGSTFDVVFPEASIPAIYNAVRVDSDIKGVSLHLVGEVQHPGTRLQSAR
jgi:F-type H+-transporting ATPase subunit beta